jgi:CHASE3 domain sensor protein
MPGRQLQQTRQNLHHTAQEALPHRDDARNSPTHGSGSQPKLMTLRAKWTLPFVAALLLLLLLGLMSYRRLKQEDAAQRWVSHTHKVMEQLDLVLATSLELDAKQGPDGNANPQLSPRTVEKLGANLSAIKTLTADNPKQQSAVEQLANLVHAGTALGQSAPKSPETAAKSKELLDQIRLILLGMRQEVEGLEGQRLRTIQSESRTARVILGTGFALALAVLAFTGLSPCCARRQDELAPRNICAMRKSSSDCSSTAILSPHGFLTWKPWLLSR